MTAIRALLGLCFANLVAAADLPGLEDKVLHSRHEIPEDEIIQLPIGRFPEPVCEYSVHHNDGNGQKIIRSVSIGDPLYHKWRCHYPHLTINMYCIHVHNCTVSNGQTVVPIIDEFGCTYFPYILPHVSYNGDLEGGIRSNAFSLSIDEPSVFFNCGIRLLIKTKGVCRRPTCVPLEYFRHPKRI